MDDPLDLFVIPGGRMLHTRECPHLGVENLTALRPASDGELDSLDVCTSCRAARDGARRRTFANLDEALEAFQCPVENRARVREVIARLPHAFVWIPAAESYIGVGAGPGTGASAYIGKGYLEVHTASGQYDRELLPVNREGGSRSANSPATRPETVCPTCYTVLPATGRCDTCP